MSNVAKLKKQAAEFELKKQFDKALAIYVKLLESFDEHADELDVALFNRVGDLMLRQGNVADAVDYYEKAVDLYADTRLLQQRHRALQQDPAPLAGPGVGLLQARQDQRAEGLQERREAVISSSTPTGCRRPARSTRRFAR